MDDIYKIEKKQAAKIASQLRYGDEVIRKIINAESEYEIDRILKQARLDNE